MIAKILRDKRIILLTLLLVLLIGIILHEGVHTPWNEAVLHLMRNLQSPTLTTIFIVITYLGYSKIVMMASPIILLYCLIQKHWRLALYWFFYSLCVIASIFLIKYAVHTPRPGGILVSPSSYSFPSGHVTLAVASYGFWVSRIAHTLRKRFVTPLFCGFVLFVVLVMLSRLYLSAHWLSDVLGGALLGTILLILVNMLYTQKPADKINPKSMAIACLLSVMICTILYGVTHLTIDKKNVQLVALI